MAAELHISISAEKLFSIGGLDITNSMLSSVLVSLILICFAILVRSQLKKTSEPTGLQNFTEMIIESLYGLVNGVTGDLKKTRLFFPLISTFFLVILFNNWLGLIPGVGTIRLLKNAEPTDQQNITESVAHEETNTLEEVETMNHETNSEHNESEIVPIFRPGTADVNTTAAFAIISVFYTQLIGIRFLKLDYFKKFINTTSPLMFFVGILELISEFAKIISFLFRLFGNIFAGEVLLGVMAFLLPLIIPMPFYGLELFVGFIQALVFALLSLVFFNMATLKNENH